MEEALVMKLVVRSDLRMRRFSNQMAPYSDLPPMFSPLTRDYVLSSDWSKAICVQQYQLSVLLDICTLAYLL